MVFRKIMLMSFGLMFLLNEGYAAQQPSAKQKKGKGNTAVTSGGTQNQPNQSGSPVGGVEPDGGMQNDQQQQSVQPQQSRKGNRGQQPVAVTHANGQQGHQGDAGVVDGQNSIQADMQHQDMQQPAQQIQPVSGQNRQQRGMQSAHPNQQVNQRQGNQGAYGQTPISGTVGAVAVIPAPFLQPEDCNKCTRENCMSKQEGTEEADQARGNALICAEYCLHAPLKLFGCVSSAYKHFCKKQPKAVQQAGDCKKLMVASNEILQVILENKDNLNSKLDASYKGSTTYRDLAITQLTQAIKKPSVDPKDPKNANLTKLLETLKLGKTNKNSEKDKGALHGLTAAQRNLPEVLSASSREAKIFATFVSLVNDMTANVAPGTTGVGGVGVNGAVPQASRGMVGGRATTPVAQQQAVLNSQATAAQARTNAKAGAQNRMASSMNAPAGGGQG